MSVHLHILGICGTFMGGIAAIAKAAGHRVTGCDANVYPPMSTQLRALGIELIEGFDADQLVRPDVWVVGNVVTRGNPLMEAILDRGERYVSGPQWLAEQRARRQVRARGRRHARQDHHVGDARLDPRARRAAPGFLIGGVPIDFGVSGAHSGRFFVIEADEYDTAFFDKRSKFVHYRRARRSSTTSSSITPTSSPTWRDRDGNSTTSCAPCPRSALDRQRRRRGAGAGARARVLVAGRGLRRGPAAGRRPAWTPRGVRRPPGRASALGRVRWNLLGEHNCAERAGRDGGGTHAGVDPAQAIEALGAVSRREAPHGGARRGARRHRLRRLRAPPDGDPTTLEGLRAARRRRAHPRGARAALEHDEARRHEGRAAGELARGRPHLRLQRGPRLGRGGRCSRRSARAPAATTTSMRWSPPSRGRRRRAITSWSCRTAASAASTRSCSQRSGRAPQPHRPVDVALSARLQLVAAAPQGAGAATRYLAERGSARAMPARRCRRRPDGHARDRARSPPAPGAVLRRLLARRVLRDLPRREARVAGGAHQSGA